MPSKDEVEKGEMANPAISIIILTFHPDDNLIKTLRKLKIQDYDGIVEIILCDSSKKDDLIERIKVQFSDVRVIRYPVGERFNYARAKNFALTFVKGEIVLFLSQDAIPLRRDFLKRMVAPFLEDEEIAGVYARQIPRPELDQELKKRIERWTPPLTERVYKRVVNWKSFILLPPEEKLRRAAFDNVASAIPKSLLEGHPFPEIPFGEDLEWSLSMLREGKIIVYEPLAEVLHSHERSPEKSYRREFLSRRQLTSLFGFKTFRKNFLPIPIVPFLVALPSRFLYILKNRIEGGVSGKRFIKELMMEPIILYSEIYGQWRGEISGRREMAETAQDPWEDVFKKRREDRGGKRSKMDQPS